MEDLFLSFLDKHRRTGNQTIIEAISEGFTILFEAMSLEQKYEKFWKKIIPEDDFKKVVEADPTKKKNYVKWMVEKLYKNNQLKMEDLYKANEYLKIFDKHKQKLQIKDINQIRTLPDLFDNIRPIYDKLHAGKYEELESKKEKEIRIKKDAENFYEDNEWVVVIPKTEEASCYYGKGTQWCTSATEVENTFYGYNEDGPLYININKRTNKKYQFHLDSLEFMDETNRPVDIMDMELPKTLLDRYMNEIKKTVEKRPERYLRLPFNIKTEMPELAKIAVNFHPPYYKSVPISVQKKLPELIKILFKRDPKAYGKVDIPEEIKQNMVKIIGMEELKESPEQIKFVPHGQKMNLVNTYPKEYERLFTIDPTYIRFFNMEERTELIKKYPSIFFHYLTDIWKQMGGKHWDAIRKEREERAGEIR